MVPSVPVRRVAVQLRFERSAGWYLGTSACKTTDSTPGKRHTWNLMAWTRLEDDFPLQPSGFQVLC